MVVVELKEEIRDIDILQKIDLIETMIKRLKEELLKQDVIAVYDNKYISVVSDKIIKILYKILYLLEINI